MMMMTMTMVVVMMIMIPIADDVGNNSMMVMMMIFIIIMIIGLDCIEITNRADIMKVDLSDGMLITSPFHCAYLFPGVFH